MSRHIDYGGTQLARVKKFHPIFLDFFVVSFSFTAIGKSTPVHVLLAYRSTVVCVNHVTIIYKAKNQSRDNVVSPTKRIEDKQRERELQHTQHGNQ